MSDTITRSDVLEGIGLIQTGLGWAALTATLDASLAADGSAEEAGAKGMAKGLALALEGIQAFIDDLNDHFNGK